MNFLLVAVSGILGALAFPKAGIWFLSFFFLVPFLISLFRAGSIKESFLLGMTFGLFYFGILFAGLSELYLYVSFFCYVAWLGLVVFESLFVAVFCVMFHLFFKEHSKSLSGLFIVASAWTALEWVRSFGEFGLSGGTIGYCLANVLPLIQIASILGVYGVSFLLVMFNIAFFQLCVCDGKLFERLRKCSLSLITVMLIFLVVLMWGYFRVAVSDQSHAYFSPQLWVMPVQGNIEQLMKMSPNTKDAIVKKYINLTRDILPLGETLSDEVRVVIWPETFVGTYLMYDASVLSEVKELIQGSGSYFLIGTPHYEAGRTYNSAILFSPDGNVAGRYDKQKPVPFGEYLPFRSIFYPLLSRQSDIFENFYSGNPNPQILSAGPYRLGVVICFESTFPYLVLQRVRAGADVIVVITNDAWFSLSSLAYQHVDISVFRAIECGKPLVEVGNTGISAVIDPFGRVLRRTRLMNEVAFTSAVPRGLKATAYVLFGDLFPPVLLLFSLLFVAKKWLNARRLM